MPDPRKLACRSVSLFAAPLSKPSGSPSNICSKPFEIRWRLAYRLGTQDFGLRWFGGKHAPPPWFQIYHEVGVVPSSFSSSQGIFDGCTRWHFKDPKALSVSWKDKLSHLPASIDTSRYPSRRLSDSQIAYDSDVGLLICRFFSALQ
jgi:hypothetical protein